MYLELYISNDHLTIIILNNGLSRHSNFLKTSLSCQLGIYMKSCGLKWLFSEDFEDVGLFQLPWPVILNEQVPEYQ